MLTFTLAVGAGSLVAGFLGAITGLGGGVVVVPLLTIAFGVDIRYAIGASLISVIATSSGAAAAYVKEGFSNLRIGVFLEIATTAGALAGAHLASRSSTSAISVVFGVVLVVSAYLSLRPRRERVAPEAPSALRRRAELPASRLRTLSREPGSYRSGGVLPCRRTKRVGIAASESHSGWAFCRSCSSGRRHPGVSLGSCR
jgi:uncharacterized protein